MKLFFKVNEDGDIIVEMLDGTTVQPFNYILMLKQLIANNTIDEPEFSGLDEVQQGKIKEILGKIQEKVAEGLRSTADDHIAQP